MRRFSPIPWHSTGRGVFCYRLADNLTTTEKIQLTRNIHSAYQLFEKQFPDLWAWISFSLEPYEHTLDWNTGTIVQDNWTFELLLEESAHMKFQQAWEDQVDEKA